MRDDRDLRPIELDDRMMFDALVQSIIDARAQEMQSTGGFAVERDGDRAGIEPIVDSVFCSRFGFGACDRFEDIFEQSARFAYLLAKDHVFADGNKRTAVRMSLSILAMRGIVPAIADPPNPKDNELYKWVQALVEGRLSDGELAALLREKSS